MTITVATASFREAQASASTTCAIELASDVPAGATIVLGIMARETETALVDSVADPVNGTWAGGTLRQGPIQDAGGTSFATWFYVLESSAALTGTSNRTITVTFDTSISSQCVAGYVTSDAGGLTFGAMATALQKSSNDTNWDSNTVACTGSGVIFGFLATNNSQATDPTADGAGEAFIDLTDVGSGRRCIMFYETFATDGSYGIEATIVSTSRGNFMVGSLLEPAGGPSAAILAAYYNMLRNS